MDRGFRRVRPLEGGFDAWADAGLAFDEEETLVAIRRRER
jgi:3-mercaptopyruvate sulfurtransferase SseA